MRFEDIRVFVCVPAVGKSFLARTNDHFVDMDALKARYKYACENISEHELEFHKGNRGNAVRKDSVLYIKNQTHKLLNETDKILLYAPNPQIVEMIYEEKIPYCLVYHSKDCIEEIKTRMRERGNQENFINSMTDNIDNFYHDSTTDTRPIMKIELHANQYLSDIFNNPEKFVK